MTEDINPVEVPKPEEKVSFLEEVKAERIKLEAVRNELKELKAEELLSGTADVPKTEEKKEVSPKDYMEAALQGKLLN